MDSTVCAELPPSPDDTDDPEEKNERERLQTIVLNNMIHGPCGKENPKCPCMVDGRCSKGYPKDFIKETTVDPDSYYANYRRRSPTDGGRTVVCPKTGRIIDNRWIVPYNPFLSKRYNSHINTEICTSPKAAKYLCKYQTKGNDRAMVSTSIEGQEDQRDEIKDYEDLRSVGSSEASWHLLGFPITDRNPPVQALRVHLEDQQQIVFDEGTEDEALDKQRETELTKFFQFNKTMREDPELDPETLPKYVDMPEEYRYDKSKKEWVKRKRETGVVIGRVHSVNPVAGDVYYLRILLHNDHCKGKMSFQDLLTLPSGQKCQTFKEVCYELGLLADDQEWQRVLEESAATKMCPQIRELFVTILMFCQPSNPKGLFEEYWSTWVDDYEKQGNRKGITLDEQQLQTMLLLDLELRLQSFEKQLQDFGLPVPTAEELARVETITRTESAVIRDEMDYNVEELAASVEETVPKFTREQQEIYQVVMDAVRSQKSLQTFINARGGCGKTFLLNAILRAVRSCEEDGCVALAMATTGIAANLLELGRTYHSRMKAPLTPDEESTLQISAQSSLAKLIQMSKLLMIDEATMLDKLQLEAMDRTLRDLMKMPEEPFGGKIVILAGDFRQCLPVVPGASRAGTVKHSINQSTLWKHFKILKLTENMRVRASGDPLLEDFDKWTVGIGNGLSSSIQIPEEMLTNIEMNKPDEPWNEKQAMKKFSKEIFPDIEENIRDPSWLEGKAVQAPTNKEVDAINELIMDWIPGESTMLSSADSLENPEDSFRFNIEYVHTLAPNGIPSHILTLKPGMPVMLMRNLNPREGLCNGTKLIYQRILDNKLLQCKIVGTERTVFIPRITFIPKIGEYTFDWQRRQFPLKKSFATTINKSQGQTLKMARVWLRTPVFSHGQLYVACSRVSHPSQLKFAIPANSEGCTNVVYHEVLLKQ